MSKVYFTNLRADRDENIPEKLTRLMDAAGMKRLALRNKFVAIKLHFGELGNLAFLRPNYARTVADKIKLYGGKPFLTDANTLYVGGRKNALDHLDTAAINGFSPLSTGCQILIADGLKGTDEVLIPVADGIHVKEAKIGRAVMDADVLVSLTHFKAHESTGIGGAIKNIGMGCGSRRGKMEMHNSGKPTVEADVCISCGRCSRECAHGAISFVETKCQIDHNHCVGCGRCLAVCPVDAIQVAYDESNEILNEKIAEYTAAVLRGRPSFHITVVTDVSPFCDCHSESDVPIVPNIGIFASFDPVSLDVACADAVNAQEPMPGSLLFGKTGSGDYFKDIHPTTNWRSQVAHAERLGLGSMSYELIDIGPKKNRN